MFYAKRIFTTIVNSIPVLFLLMALLSVSAGVSGCKPLGLGYVGTDTCLRCHNGKEAVDKTGFLESFHASIGCEECHGPGALHVRNGGRYGFLIGEGNTAVCEKCHLQEAVGFKESLHAKANILDCIECHDPHSKQETTRSFVDNQLCLKCHSYQGFATEADITNHTFHPYDPTGTGASRCVICHMVPAGRTNQDAGLHYHSMIPVQPIQSNQTLTPPLPPNSCAGITGCHDGTVPYAPTFNVDDPTVNENLQTLFEARYAS